MERPLVGSRFAEDTGRLAAAKKRMRVKRMNETTPRQAATGDMTLDRMEKDCAPGDRNERFGDGSQEQTGPDQSILKISCSDNNVWMATKKPLYEASTQFKNWRYSPENLAQIRHSLNKAAVATIRDKLEADEVRSLQFLGLC